MDDRDPSSAEGSPNIGLALCGVSSECLGLITSYLAYSDIIALKITGNMLLNAKIDLGMSEVRFELWPLSKWPSHVFNWRNLRSLCASSGGNEELYHPILAPQDNLLPQEPHPALQRLEVSATLSFTLLSSNTLAVILPNLRVLKLAGDGKFVKHMLRHVPQTVVDFAIKVPPVESNNDEIQLTLSDIAILPRDLHSLSLRGRTLKLSSSTPAEMVQKALPSQLNRLRLTVTDISRALSGIPLSIRRLTLEGTGGKIVTAVFSHVLPRLEYLRILVPPFGYLDLQHIGPFPEGLTTLRTPYKTSLSYQGSGQKDDGLLLPLSLTRIEGYDTLTLYSDHKAKLPNLSKIKVDDIETQAELDRLTLPSKQLRQVILNDLNKVPFNATFFSKLPNTITSLYASIKNTPLWLETILRLDNLRKLELHANTEALPIATFWNRISPRLEYLRAWSTHFESIEGFCGDWSKLKELVFFVPRDYELPPNSVIDLDTGLPIIHGNTSYTFTYPASLERLQLQTGSHWAFFWHQLSYATRLMTLKLELMANSVMSEEESIAANQVLRHLPSSLRFLTAGYCVPYGPEHFSDLPQGLRSLEIVVEWPPRPDGKNYRKQLLSLNDLVHLPPSLTSFNVHAKNFSNGVMSPGSHLPSTLVHTNLSTLRSHFTTGWNQSRRQADVIRYTPN